MSARPQIQRFVLGRVGSLRNTRACEQQPKRSIGCRPCLSGTVVNRQAAKKRRMHEGTCLRMAISAISAVGSWGERLWLSRIVNNAAARSPSRRATTADTHAILQRSTRASASHRTDGDKERRRDSSSPPVFSKLALSGDTSHRQQLHHLLASGRGPSPSRGSASTGTYSRGETSLYGQHLRALILAFPPSSCLVSPRMCENRSIKAKAVPEYYEPSLNTAHAVQAEFRLTMRAGRGHGHGTLNHDAGG